MSKKVQLLFLSVLLFLSACNSITNSSTDSTTTNLTQTNQSTTTELVSDIVFTYTQANNQITITGFSGTSENLIIPEEIDDYPVTIIGEEAFIDASQFTNIRIPDSVSAIEDSAFKNCSGLLTVTIPDSVTHIGRWAFENCSALTSVVIGDGITTLKLSTFRNCSSIKSIKLSVNLIYIEDEVFSNNTSLENIELPGSVFSIGRRAFSNCISLRGIFIPDSVSTMGTEVFYNCNDLIIYTSWSSKPFEWSSSWNPTNCYVLWETELVTITFDSNGGSSVQKIYGSYGDSINAPTVPSKSGFVFSGWYLDQALTTPYVFTIIPENSIVVYAKWQLPSTYQSTLDQIQELWDDLADEATPESLVDITEIYLSAISAIEQAENQTAASIIQQNFQVEFLSAFIRDYPRIDLTYAKSTATQLMQNSITLVYMIPDFEPTQVLNEYIYLINKATTIIEVDNLLEDFINEIAEAINFEGQPPAEMVQGFKQASVGAVTGVYTNINNTSNQDMGFSAIEETYLNDLIYDINSSSDIPDITRFVFYGIRSMFQSLGNQATTYFSSQITAEYNANRAEISPAELDEYDQKYNSAITNIQAMQFYETKQIIYMDYINF
jgi:uncharacterized repeat protein (TIGR02543 family)